jgi:hypothetical protein
MSVCLPPTLLTCRSMGRRCAVYLSTFQDKQHITENTRARIGLAHIRPRGILQGHQICSPQGSIMWGHTWCIPHCPGTIKNSCCIHQRYIDCQGIKSILFLPPVGGSTSMAKVPDVSMLKTAGQYSASKCRLITQRRIRFTERHKMALPHHPEGRFR